MRMLLALCLSLPALAVAGPTSEGPKPGDAAPDFALVDHTGKTHKLADYKGKVVVLEWTNPECPFVVRHYKAKTMTTLAQKYAGKEIVWLAVNSSHFANPAINKAFVEKEKLTYAVLDDAKGAVGNAYGARTTPDMFVVDPAGKIAYRGAIDNDPFGDKPAAEKVNYIDVAVPAVFAKGKVALPQTKPYGCSVKYASK
ncbi:MAG: peroxiredoxin [Bradymonadia bacterium]|jgi:peroxiredoxin